MRPSLFSAFIGLVLAITVAIVAHAGGIDDLSEVVADYTEGRRLMREGDYFGASRIFSQLEGRHADSKNLDLFIFHRSKCDYYLGEFSQAAAGFSYFLSRYSASPEAPYAHLFLANCHYRRANVTEAVKSYLEAYRLSNDGRLDEIVQASLEAAFSTASSVALAPELLENLPVNKRCPLVKVVAPLLVQSGDTTAAEQLLVSCGERLDRSRSEQDRQRRKDGPISIAMMLPFSGELAGYGQEIYNGAVIAAEQFRTETGQNLELQPYDTRGDPIDAARVATELARDPSVLAAIGPLTSDAAALTSATLACRSLPLIVPAATQAGLARLSENSFQLSPNIELQGLMMARYAVDSLNADSAVIVTSTSADHLRMSRAFAEQFEKLGGTVAAVEYYRSRDKDFGPYLRDVKAMLWGLHPDSIYFVNEYGDTLDPDGIPVSVDCLYLPGSPQQLRLLLPQIRFYKLEGAYLGSDAWADEAVTKLGDNVTRNAVFPSPFLSATNSEEYLRFAAAYDARFGKRPPRLAALGYDALRLTSLAALEADGDREKLTGQLSRTINYVGASGEINLSANRENTHMPLYRITDGEALPIGHKSSMAEEEQTE